MKQGKQQRKLQVGTNQISVEVRPATAAPALILANGAGAPLRSPFMQHFASALAGAGITTILFNFPYQEVGRKSPDRPAILEETYRAIVEYAREVAESGQLFIGGKSMGGRIAAHIAPQTQVQGLVYLGYPLHPPGKPEQLRDKVLYDIAVPQLFLSGSRDSFCDLSLLRKVIKKCKKTRLVEIPGGDHSFKVPARGPITQDEAFAMAVKEITQFVIGSV